MRTVNAGLLDIASLQVGFSFRRGVETNRNGDYLVVQMKDLVGSSVDLGSASQVADEGFRENHVLNAGDLVFRSRGSTFRVSEVPQTDRKIVLAAPLFRIRVNSGAVLPEYLAWFLNLNSTQMELAAKARGTAQQLVSLNELGQLLVSVPNLELQKSIVEISALSSREQALLEKLASRRHTLLTHILESAISSSRSHS